MSDPDVQETRPLGDTPSRNEAGEGSSVLKEAQSLWRELHGLAHDRFRLAGLETRRAGESLIVMLVAGVILAIVLSGMWLGILAAVVMGLVEHGMPASIAILLALVFNGLIGFALAGLIRLKSRDLQFPATLRSLHPKSDSRLEEDSHEV